MIEKKEKGLLLRDAIPRSQHSCRGFAREVRRQRNEDEPDQEHTYFEGNNGGTKIAKSKGNPDDSSRLHSMKR